MTWFPVKRSQRIHPPLPSVTVADFESTGQTATKPRSSSCERCHTTTGTFQKKRPNSIVGLVFRQNHSGGKEESDDHFSSTTYIEKISRTAARKTNLVPGLAVLTINGIKVESAAHAATLVRRSFGQVVLEAQGRCLETKRRRIGLSTKFGGGAGGGLTKLNQLEDGKVQIQSLPAKCCPPGSSCEGQILVAINGVTPIDSVERAMQLLSSKRNVRLVVAPPPTPLAAAANITTGGETTIMRSESYSTARTSLLSERSSSRIDHLTIDPNSSSSSCYTIKSSLSSVENLVETIDAHMPGEDGEHDDIQETMLLQRSKVPQDDDREGPRADSPQPPHSAWITDHDASSTSSSLSSKAGSQEAQQEQERRAVVLPSSSSSSLRRVVVSLIKPNRLCDTGLSFVQQHHRGVGIRHVSDSGLFAETPLQVGDRLLSINGTSCLDDVLQVHKILHQCEGRLTLEVLQGEYEVSASSSSMKDFTAKMPGRVILQLQKTDPESKVGLSLRKGNDGARYIHPLPGDGGGLLGSIGEGILPTGSRLDRINGKPCPDSRQELSQKLQSFPLIVLECVVLQEDQISTSGTARKAKPSSIDDRPARIKSEVVMEKAFKKTSDTKVGLSLKKCSKTDSIVIFAIAQEGLFAFTDLRVGQRVVRINGMTCPESLMEAIQLIRDTTGSVYIETESSTPERDTPLDHVATVLPKKKRKSKEASQEPRKVPPSDVEVEQPSKVHKDIGCNLIKKSSDDGLGGVSDTIRFSHESRDDEFHAADDATPRNKDSATLEDVNTIHRSLPLSLPRLVSVSNVATLDLLPSKRKKKEKRRTQVDVALDLANRISARENEFEAEASELQTRMSVASRVESFDYDEELQQDLQDTKKCHDNELRAVENTIRDFSDAYEAAMDCTTTTTRIQGDAVRPTENVSIRLAGNTSVSASRECNTPQSKTSDLSDLDAYAELVGGFDVDAELLAAYMELKQAEEESCAELEKSSQDIHETTSDENENADDQHTWSNDNDTNVYGVLSTDNLIEQALLLARSMSEDEEETIDFRENDSDDYSIRTIEGDESFASHLKAEEALFAGLISPINGSKALSPL
jgi:hypothetical protein